MTVEEKLPVASTKMAALTICAEQPYKHEGFFFNESLFDEQTCTFQELFHSSTLEQFDEKVKLRSLSKLKPSFFYAVACYLAI